jgi:hypothetical protein
MKQDESKADSRLLLLWGQSLEINIKNCKH